MCRELDSRCSRACESRSAQGAAERFAQIGDRLNVSAHRRNRSRDVGSLLFGLQNWNVPRAQGSEVEYPRCLFDDEPVNTSRKL